MSLYVSLPEGIFGICKCGFGFMKWRIAAESREELLLAPLQVIFSLKDLASVLKVLPVLFSEKQV